MGTTGLEQYEYFVTDTSFRRLRISFIYSKHPVVRSSINQVIVCLIVTSVMTYQFLPQVIRCMFKASVLMQGEISGHF